MQNRNYCYKIQNALHKSKSNYKRIRIGCCKIQNICHKTQKFQQYTNTSCRMLELQAKSKLVLRTKNSYIVQEVLTKSNTVVTKTLV